jgi:hypothetical protein
MRFPIIKVKDLVTGKEHIVGIKRHDQLKVVDGNFLVYNNLQNGEGTLGDYSFIPGEDTIEMFIDFVSFEELKSIHASQEEKEKRKQKEREWLIESITIGGVFDDE